MQRLYERQRQNIFHRPSRLAVPIVPERLIVPFLLRVADNKARQSELDKLKVDENSPQAAIPVAKGMDGLKIQVELGNLIEEVGAEIIVSYSRYIGKYQ